MKKLLLSLTLIITTSYGAAAYQVLSSKELGRGETKNQNVVVKCTTDTGDTSNQTCSLRRYVKCTVDNDSQSICTTWQPWRDLRNPTNEYSNWKAAASACCRAKGLR
ncbi:MAG: hypothetical protein R8N50_00840 [Alphaproteobacteria bacterium]|nr:hypothetical protein [Alphaproteobacteria bacterium]